MKGVDRLFRKKERGYDKMKFNFSSNYVLLGVLAGLCLAFGYFVFQSHELKVVQESKQFESIIQKFDLLNCTSILLSKPTNDSDSIKISCEHYYGQGNTLFNSS